MENVILIVVLVLIIGCAAGYVIKAKKNGKKCIGCPNGASSSCSQCGSCPGGCNSNQ